MQIFDLLSYFFDYEPVHTCYSTAGQLTDLLETLNDLSIADDCLDPKYARKEWRHWIDEDRDGLNTRQEVLLSESLIAPILSNDSKKVIAGRWYDPYTDKLFAKPGDLDIDHFVPLGEAHKSGGCYWSNDTKKLYANDLKHDEQLIAVSKRANRQKGQKDPAQWLPTNEDYHCEYVSNWILIKDRWNLWIDMEEKTAIETVIKTKCQWAC